MEKKGRLPTCTPEKKKRRRLLSRQQDEARPTTSRETQEANRGNLPDLPSSPVVINER